MFKIFFKCSNKYNLMLIIGIDQEYRFNLFFEDGKIIDVVEMPTMTEGKKNKRQVNSPQVYNEIFKEKLKKLIKRYKK